jgi:hypothetical protein
MVKYKAGGNMKLVEVSDELYNEAIDIYFLWKELNNRIKKHYSRGVNIHEFITEVIVSYVNNFKISLGGSSEDALSNDGKKIQIKATSNFDDDLTSFGPSSVFDELHFARLDQKNDCLYLYVIPLNDLKNLHVNKEETFYQQQQNQRRPRFSIIKEFIIKKNLNHYAKIDLIKK